jgi:hypothetical protein
LVFGLGGAMNRRSSTTSASDIDWLPALQRRPNRRLVCDKF